MHREVRKGSRKRMTLLPRMIKLKKATAKNSLKCSTEFGQRCMLGGTLDEAPTNSMLLRAGGVTPRRSTADIVSQTITQLARAMLLATPSSSTAHSCLSPARKIKNRCKYYKQLAELKILTNLEFLMVKSMTVSDKQLWKF